MPVTRINDFRAAPAKESELRDFLSDVIAVIRDSAGCRSVELLVDREDPAHLVIVEAWSDVASHQAAAGRIPPEKLAQVRPLLAEPPKGRYYDPVDPGPRRDR
jgi:quinol monooxygenase YgiN